MASPLGLAFKTKSMDVFVCVYVHVNYEFYADEERSECRDVNERRQWAESCAREKREWIESYQSSS